MKGISKSELNHLYRGKDIQSIWSGAKTLDVIKHPELGYISPNRFRQIYTGASRDNCKIVQDRPQFLAP